MDTLIPQLREQHAELCTAVEGFLALVRHPQGPQAPLIRQLMGPLAEALHVHLDLEDQRFYPAARAHADPDLAALATRYWTTMGSIRELLDGFLDTWSVPGRIEADPQGLVREAEVVIGYLLRRVEREERDLYPRLLGEGPGGAPEPS